MYVLAPYMYVYTLLLFCKEKHTYNFYAVFVIVMCRAQSLKKKLYAHTDMISKLGSSKYSLTLFCESSFSANLGLMQLVVISKTFFSAAVELF